MKFTVEQTTEPAIIAINGDVLGGADAMEFTRGVGQLVRDGARKVIVDLNGVELMNSSGLGMLVGGAKTVRGAGGEFCVVGANQKILSLFKMTRLDAVFRTFATREDALA